GWRHLEGAHPEEPETPGRAVRRIELVDTELGTMSVTSDVDQQIAHQPVDKPGRARLGAPAPAPLHLAERDFDFVDRIVACLVDARGLRSGADEKPREHV